MNLRIEKGSVLAVVWDACTEPFKKRTSQESILFPVGMESVSAGFSLTVGRLFATVKTPNQSSRNRRLALAPQGAEDLSAHTAIFHAPAGTVSGGWRVYVGGVATSSIREDWRLRLSLGALWPRLFFFNPKSIEVPHA